MVGVTMVKSYEVEKDVRLTISESIELGGYTAMPCCSGATTELRLWKIVREAIPNYTSIGANQHMKRAPDRRP